MSVNLKGRSFLTLMDFSPEEIRYLLDLAAALKAKKKALASGTPWTAYAQNDARGGKSAADIWLRRQPAQLLAGRNICLMFEKTSTRTRCSFEVAAYDEGAHVTFLDPGSSQVGKKESIEDSAKVLGRFFDGIEYRGYEQSLVEDLARFSGVPVWNGLTDIDHPTQILADMLTIEEHIDKPLADVKVVFVGDVRNNMSYAWMYGCAKMGMDFVAYGPDELVQDVDPEVLARVLPVAEKTGATITVTSDEAALGGADVIYTDVWASMGEEEHIPERVRLLTPYKVTAELLAKTDNDKVKFMHCLPAFHDFSTQLAKTQKEEGYDIREVTDEVFRSAHSIVFDEAENRMHTIKAVMVATLA